MGTTDRRLRTLEAIWPAPSDPDETDLSHLRWWSRPLFLGGFRQFCTKRAEERFIHTERGGRYGGQSSVDPGWLSGGVTEGEREARIRFEHGELDRLIALYGEEIGWASWHAQAADWPQRYGGVTEDDLKRRLMHAWETADGNRVHPSKPLWRRVWPEWNPGMTFDEHCAFDRLLAEEGEARCARSTPVSAG